MSIGKSIKVFGVCAAIVASASIGDLGNINNRVYQAFLSKQQSAHYCIESSMSELEKKAKEFSPVMAEYKDKLTNLGLNCEGEYSPMTQKRISTIAADYMKKDPLKYETEIKSITKSLIERCEYNDLKEIFNMNPSDEQDRLLNEKAKENLKTYSEKCQEIAKQIWINVIGYVSTKYLTGGR